MSRYMKYEIKGSYRFILGVLALVLILTTGVYAYTYNSKTGSSLGAMFVGLSIMVIFGTLLATFLYIVNSFRKELYEDRGYLTFTLPLSGNQILGSKLMVAVMWFVLIGIVIVVYNLAVALIVVPQNIDLKRMLTLIKDIVTLKRIFIMMLTMFIGGIITLITIYFSMTLSRVTFRNKKIGSLWFIIFLVLSGVVTYIQIKVIELFPYYLNLDTFKIMASDMLDYSFGAGTSGSGLLMAGSLDSTILNIAGFIYNLATGILMFLATGYLIENRIDL